MSSGALNDAYQRIVAAGLFETVELIPQGGTLLIKVKEYPMLNVVDFQGNKRLKDEKAGQSSNPNRGWSIRRRRPGGRRRHCRGVSRAGPSGRQWVIRASSAARTTALIWCLKSAKAKSLKTRHFLCWQPGVQRPSFAAGVADQAGRLPAAGDQGRYFHPRERLEVDKQMLRDFYLSRGYIDVQVVDATGQLSRERDANFVTYTVREGQSFNIGKISTVSEIPRWMSPNSPPCRRCARA